MGVVFMISLASLVQYIRQNIRAGVLYFIRNPHDPEYHPVKDMIEISIWKHLYKIINSLVFYSAFCMIFFYSTSVIIRKLIPQALPLYQLDGLLVKSGSSLLSSTASRRDHQVELPFETVINILFLRIMWLIKPVSVISLVKKILQRLLRILRLSSYFLGRGRYLNEELFGPKGGRWAYVPDYDRLYKRERLREMYRKSVDPSGVARMAIIEGTPNQTTINATTNLLLEELPLAFPTNRLSNHHSMNNGNGNNNGNDGTMTNTTTTATSTTRRQRGVFKGFAIVYVPANFRLRILILIGAIWMIFQMIVIGFVICPTLLGRWLFSKIPPIQGINDLYCFFLGFPILVMSIKIGEIVTGSITSTDPKLLKSLVTHYPCKIIQTIFCLFVMLVIWPFVIGLYMLLLLSPWILNYDKSSVLYPASLWSCGLSAVKFIYVSRNYLLSPERNAIIREIKNNGWNVSFSRVISLLILPYTLRMFLLILLPPLVVSLILSPILKLSDNQIVMLQRWSFTFTLVVPLIIISVQSLLDLKRKLMAGIRDEEYLLGRQLLNFEGR